MAEVALNSGYLCLHLQSVRVTSVAEGLGWQSLPDITQVRRAGRDRREGDVELITARKHTEGEAELRREAPARERRSPGREGRDLHLRGCVRVGIGIKCTVEPGKECQRHLCKIAQASGLGRLLCRGNPGGTETWRW